MEDLDQFLKTRWRHSRGWSIGIAGTAIDSGGREGRTQKVYNFCYPRMDRRVFTIKGLPGKRKVWTKLTSVKGGHEMLRRRSRRSKGGSS